MMLWRPQSPSFRVFVAVLASAMLVTASPAQQDAVDRRRMVEEIDAMLASAAGTSGVARLSPRVRAAMTEVPRHQFVPLAYRSEAYSNRLLPIGHGQAAILSALAREVYTIEIVPELGKLARADLERLGYSNVSTRIGDGYQGWAEHALFDAIIVTAAPNHVPQPLIAQLRSGGRMVIPVGDFDQELMVLAKHADGMTTTTTNSSRSIRALDPGVAGGLEPLGTMGSRIDFRFRFGRS